MDSNLYIQNLPSYHVYDIARILLFLQFQFLLILKMNDIHKNRRFFLQYFSGFCLYSVRNFVILWH